MKRGILLLEDGFALEGQGFGADGEALGEVVFNTSMAGYQEILTDPSYKGQIVAMTYPLIGNYGVNPEDVESHRPWVEGFLVKESSRVYSNWRGTESLDTYLARNKIVAMQGLDTRALTRHLRLRGAMRGVLSTVDFDRDRLLKKVLDSPAMVGRDLIPEVTCAKAYEWVNQASEAASPKKKAEFFVGCLDFGVKFNSLRFLEKTGCRIKVFPAATRAEEILGLGLNGVFLSNGPGDPAVLTYAVEEIKKLLGRLPLFGICLGHQLIGHALGGKTYKLKFGHHGGNHPVMDLETKKVEITSQNHGFCVDMDSFKDKNVLLTHVNLYDKTTEGLRHKKWPVFSVQYHPEAAPGPHDSNYLFGRFAEMMRRFGKRNR